MILGLIIGLTGVPGSGNGLTCLRDFGTFFIMGELLETAERSCIPSAGKVVSAPDVWYTDGLTGDKLCLLAKLITGTMARSTKNVKKRCMLILSIVFYTIIQTDLIPTDIRSV